MNWLDLLIVLFLATALVRGTEVGFIRQFCSTLGFFVGLFIGAWLQAALVSLAGTPSARALVALLITLGVALVFMTLGEYTGLLLKARLHGAKITNKLDKIFGAALAAATLLAAVWLSSAIFRNIPDGGWQRQIRGSRIVNLLENNLLSAPGLLTKLGSLIDPNGFPQVFSGLEPRLKTDTPMPDMGELTPAIQAVRPSVVKIEGEGCNVVVEGSGFVSGEDEVITNAHVVAGVKNPYVLDQKGRHSAKVVWFNPELDLAVLRTKGLTGKPLKLETQEAQNSTAVAVLGYPQGAGFTVTPGVILETFAARGRNIYNKGDSIRQVYSVKTDIHQGNSGGPIINKDGSVLGVVFANSVNYQQVGYALTMKQVVNQLELARSRTATVNNTMCTE